MADEEKKDYTESKNSFMDILARGGEGLIDGFAKSNPMIGGALQAMVGTQDYQDRVDARNYEREQREHGRQVMAEWYQNKATRDAVNQATMKSAQAEGMKADEYMSPEAQAARKAGYKADTEKSKLQSAQAKYGQSMVWSQRQNDYSKNMTQDYINHYAGDPNCTMSIGEITSMANSPAVQTAIKAQYWLDNMLWIGCGDKDAFDEIDNELNQMGWDAYFDGDVMYLKMGNENAIPVTRESFSMLGNIISGNMAAEQQARDAVCLNNSIGNPDRMWNRKMTEAASKFTGGNYAEAKKFIEGYTNRLSPEQCAWMRLSQAYEDFGDTSLPMNAKMNELAACMESLQRLGYGVEGFDPSNPATIMMATIKELGNTNGKTYTFQEFGELCNQKDTVSRDIAGRITENMMRFAQDTMLKAAQNVKDTAKAAKGEEDEAAMQEKKAREAFNKTALQLWGYTYSGLDDDEKDKLYSAKNDLDVLVNQYFERENVDKVTSLSAEALEDMRVGWDKTIKSLNLSSSDFKFPFKELLDAKKKERDKQKTEEKKAKKTDSMDVSDLLRQRRKERESKEEKERELDDKARRAAQQTMSLSSQQLNGWGNSYGRSSAL